MSPSDLSPALYDFVWRVLHQPGLLKARAPQAAGAEPSHQDKLMEGLVDLLFDFIAQDKLIAPGMRPQLARLKSPFLSAFSAEPDLMHEPGHPARELCNRIAAVAIGMGADQTADQSMATRIEQLIGQLLSRFNGDSSVFKVCLTQFEAYLGRQLRHQDTLTSLCGEAIDEAEGCAAVAFNTTLALLDYLGPLAIDERVHDFVTGPWLEVMVHPLSWNPQLRGPETHEALRHGELLPELLWSSQEKKTTRERAELAAMLPGLVARIRKGFELTGLDQERAKQAMDQLVAVHADVLRGKQGAPAFGKRVMTLEQLHGRFHSLALDPNACAGPDGRPILVRPLALRTALGRRDVAANTLALVLSYEQYPPMPKDAAWLRQMRVGTAVMLRIDGKEVPACLSATSPHGCLFMFSVRAAAGAPHIYSCTSMLKALHDGHIRPLEDSPLFDRALASLMGDIDEITAAD
ncbi:MAG: DUF1631 family protein [Pseudomonadota bacterium]